MTATASVSFGASGQVVLAWEAIGSFRNDIWLRRFDSANQPMGDPVLANVTDADDQRNPRLAVRPDGKVFAIWQSDEVDNSQAGSPIRVWIRGRLFNANLTPASSEVLISSIFDKPGDRCLGRCGRSFQRRVCRRLGKQPKRRK